MTERPRADAASHDSPSHGNLREWGCLGLSFGAFAVLAGLMFLTSGPPPGSVPVTENGVTTTIRTENGVRTMTKVKRYISGDRKCACEAVTQFVEQNG
jgi:hypothetical protein